MGGWLTHCWTKQNPENIILAKNPSVDNNNNNSNLPQDTAMVEVGFRVIRGPDWKWENQDGGDGHVGTVVEVGHVGNRLSPDKTVVVQWDNGRRTNYRVGYKGAYDLLVFDGAPAGIGVKHLNKRCDGCGRRDIKGIRWQCTQCSDYDLCTRCYMENVHDIQHKFRRFLTNRSTGVLIPKPRAKSRRSQASGIFPGAKVIRGCDWIWGNQDGGPGGIGTVTELRGWQNESENSVASVTFPGNRTNVYRIGHRGKVDLKCVTPAKGPMYYKDHLPVLGRESQGPCPFVVGDKVRVCLSVDVLKQMQQGHGGWNPKMVDLIDIVGVVHRITQNGDVRVQYRTPVLSSEATRNASSTSSAETNRWTFNPAALTKTPIDCRFSVSVRVRVIEDYTRVKALQSREHRNWNEKMKEYLGRNGIVVEVYSDGDVRVEFHSPQRQWTFNPDCLILESDNVGPLEIVPPEMRVPPSANELITTVARGELQAVKQILQEHPDMINAHCRQIHGRTPLHVAAYKSQTEIVRFLLSKGADMSATDDEGDGALHFAMVSKSNESVRNDCARLLLEKATPADVNLMNKTKKTPLHAAVIHNNQDGTKRILKLGCDVNLQDDDGDTAAHCCVTNHGCGEMTRLLLAHPNFDPECTNKGGFNILHKAAVRGYFSATEIIIEKFPNLALAPKSDDGMTALHLSVLNSHERISELLLEKFPALIDKQDGSGQTPLYVAASIEEPEPSIVELLVRAGANISIPAFDGRTCVHAALEKYNSEESTSASNYLSGDTDLTTGTLVSEDNNELSGLFPSVPIWEEIRDVLLRNGMVSENAVYLGIACYLVRSALDQCLDDEDFLTDAFESAHDEKARTILRDIQKNRTMSIMASDFSKIVNVKEDSPRKLQSSPLSRLSPLQHDLNNHHHPHHPHFSQNYVKGLADDVGANVTEVPDCVSCGEEEASVVFRPCGHKIVCAECCVRMKRCIQCQTSIVSKVDQDGVDISVKSLEQQETVLQLERKVRELQESNQCIICMENQRDTVLKCGHRFCEQCATTLRKHCPICRKPITGAIHLYN